MTAFQWVWTIAIVVLCALLSFALVLVLRRLRPDSQFLADQFADVLNTATIRGRRYEVLLSDWEDNVAPEMRWRWAIMDADRFLWVMAHPTASASDPMGIGDPFMLGNAPTRAMAEAEALTWIAQQGATSIVASA